MDEPPQYERSNRSWWVRPIWVLRVPPFNQYEFIFWRGWQVVLILAFFGVCGAALLWGALTGNLHPLPYRLR